MKNKIFSICIDAKEIKKLKIRIKARISHPINKRWLSLYKKQCKKVRFYDNNGLEEGVFVINSIRQRRQLNEEIIELKIVYENS